MKNLAHGFVNPDAELKAKRLRVQQTGDVTVAVVT
jgi:hypothetical protein